MREREAVERLREGDVGGLEPLVREHYVRAVRAAYLITRDRPLAEEVAQEAFIRAYERIHRFDLSRPFAPWLLRIVVHGATDAATRRGRERARTASTGEEQGIAAADLLPEEAPGPDEILARAEERAWVWSALDQLPPTQRAAVVMRYYLDLSEGEMAERLAVPPGTVKWRLHAARQRLQSLLRP